MSRSIFSRAHALALLLAATAPAYASAAAPTGALASFDPADPQKSGYRLVFEDDFTNPNTIDWQDSRHSGFNWYRGEFFGKQTAPAASISLSGGVLVLNAPDNTQIATAAPLPRGHGWVGRVFGGGFFIEARLAFDPAQGPHPRAWPAFWSMAIEHLEGAPPGTFEHFIEDDFFENDTDFAGMSTYGGAMHDWFGVYKVTCPVEHYCSFTNNGRSGAGNFVIHTKPETDWTQFHIFGQLWLPAEASHIGSATYFFDNTPTNDVVTWPASAGPHAGQTAPFAIIDQDHLAIILETGGGQAMRVAWVKVWQNPEKEDDQTR